MPIFDNACQNKLCNNVFETIQKVEETPPPCPLCGTKAKREISACGWELKGEGWFNPSMPKKRARGGCPKK